MKTGMNLLNETRVSDIEELRQVSVTRGIWQQGVLGRLVVF